MKQDLRWMLIFAWICFAVAAWVIARKSRAVWWITGIAAILLGAGFFWMNWWLRPTATIQTANPSPPPKALTTTPTLAAPITKAVPLQSTKTKKVPSPQSTPAPTAPPSQTAKGNNNTQVEGGVTTGPCSNVQIGGSGNQAIGGNCGPPPLVLDVTSVESGSSERSLFTEKAGFVKTEVTIVPNQQVTAPFTVALDFDNPISEIGHTVKNVGTQMGGGPFRVGIHARETVLTSIGPSHPLVVVVFSLLKVKLVAAPRIEY
jgi:hypothetical protein